MTDTDIVERLLHSAHPTLKEREAVEVILSLRTSLEQANARIKTLEWAARGGNATNDNATLFEFLADRLAGLEGRSNADYMRAAKERASMLRSALKGRS